LGLIEGGELETLDFSKDVLRQLLHLVWRTTDVPYWQGIQPAESGQQEFQTPDRTPSQSNGGVPNLNWCAQMEKVRNDASNNLQRQLFALPQIHPDRLIMWEYLVSCNLEKTLLTKNEPQYITKKCEGPCNCTPNKVPNTNNVVLTYGWSELDYSHMLLCPVDLWRSTLPTFHKRYKRYFMNAYKYWVRGETLTKPLSWANWLFTLPKKSLKEEVLSEVLSGDSPEELESVHKVVQAAAAINLARNKIHLAMYKLCIDPTSPLWRIYLAILARLVTQQNQTYLTIAWWLLHFTQSRTPRGGIPSRSVYHVIAIIVFKKLPAKRRAVRKPRAKTTQTSKKAKQQTAAQAPVI
jgi:hypothetical protein